MEVSVVSNFRKSDVMVPTGKRKIADINNRLKLCRIRIAPELISLRTFPRKRTSDLDAVCHLVISKICKVWVIGQNKIQVVYAILKKTCPWLILQTLLPIVIRSRKVCLCFRETFICCLQLHLVLLHGKLAHFLKRSLLIKVTKLMNTDNIKGITKFQVCRVLCVMRVNKLILLDLHASHTAGCNKVIAVLVFSRFIYVRKKCIKGTCNWKKHSIEKTNSTLFC